MRLRWSRSAPKAGIVSPQMGHNWALIMCQPHAWAPLLAFGLARTRLPISQVWKLRPPEVTELPTVLQLVSSGTRIRTRTA